MALLFSKISNTSLIGVWHITESLVELEENPLISCFVEESKKFKSMSRRAEWLAVRLLVHTLLGEKKEIAYYPSGRPYLTDLSYSISISHTKGYVAVVLDEKRNVAIDIEHYSDRILSLVPRFVRSDEEFYDSEDLYTPLLIWSAKETLFKLIDQSGVDFKQDLYVLPFPLAESGSFIAYEYKTLIEGNGHLIHYLTNPSFVLTYTME